MEEDSDDIFEEYSRTLLSSRNIIYTCLNILEQQENTLQRLAVTAALHRASRSTSTASTPSPRRSVENDDTTEPPRQRRRTSIYTRRSQLQSPIRSSVRFRTPVAEPDPQPPHEDEEDEEEIEPRSAAPTRDERIPFLRRRPLRSPPERQSVQSNPVADLFTQAILNTLGQLSPVRVTPSASQIARATERMTFSELPDGITRYQTCPICHDTFTPESEVIRIRHCGHYFSRDAIMTWFDMNCHCPICRHDIRDGLSPSTSDDNNETHHEEYLESPDNTTNNNTNNNTNIPATRGLGGIVDAITQDLQRRAPNGTDIGPVSYSFEFVPTIYPTDRITRRRAGLPSRREAYPGNNATRTSSYTPDHLTSSFDIANNTTNTTDYNPINYTSTYNRDYLNHTNTTSTTNNADDDQGNDSTSSQ